MAKIKIEDNNEEQKRIEQGLRYINSKNIKIGILGSEDSKVLMIASVHEFGVSIEVTEKMQGWFMAQGYAPPQGTVEIPERSYIRASFDEHSEEMGKTADRLIIRFLDGKETPQTVLNKIGLAIENQLKDYITKLDDPPLSQMTKEMRTGGGNQNPLVDSGHNIRDRISYEIE